MKGCGTLFVEAALWPYLVFPETPDEWQYVLLLPEEWKVLAVRRIGVGGKEDRFDLTVTHKCIPETADETRTMVSPSYLKHVDGKVELFDVVVQQFDGQRWKTIARENMHDEAT